MKTILIFLIITAVGSSFITPQALGDNEFCNIQENLKIQEELIKDDIVLIEFLKVLPSAELTRATGIDESNPEQTSMTWNAGVYSFTIHIWGYDIDNPSDCFFPVGYSLNAPHLPEMIGLDYHKDPQIVLDQIDDLEPKYVKGGPAPMDLIPEPVSDTPIYENCGLGTILQDGVCVVTLEQESVDTFGKWEAPYEKLPQPNLRASCSFDGVIAMWFYQFIVNPLCEIGIQIMPDYECNCSF